MAKNVVYKDADYLSLPVPTGTLSGAPVRVGDLNGVAQTNEGSVDIAAAEALAPNYRTSNGASSNKAGYASVALKGAARFAIDDAVANVGQSIYFDASDDSLTVDPDDGATPDPNPFPLFGHALSVKASGAGTVIVRIAN